MIDLSLILPVHNEEDIIEPVFKSIYGMLLKMKIGYEIILVENGSADNSLEIIRKLAKNFSNTKVLIAKQGYGSAIIAGLAKSRGDYVCYMPSDGQVDIELLPKLWHKITKEKWDVVKIKRVGRESLQRLLISWILSIVIMILFRTPFWDINGDPRIFKKENLSKLDLKYKDSFIDSEFSVKTKLLGLKVHEIKTKTLPRTGGKSTRSIHTFLEFFKNLWEFKTGKSLALWKKKQLIH